MSRELDNRRVLRFDSAAFKSNGANADGVLGQPDFTSTLFNTAQNGMTGPSGVAVDGNSGTCRQRRLELAGSKIFPGGFESERRECGHGAGTGDSHRQVIRAAVRA